jgi:ribonuclease-3
MDDRPPLGTLEQRLGYPFSNRSLLEEAVAHRSWSQDHEPPIPDNERLEFLGDAVLGLVVADRLFRTFPDPEGRLTQARSAAIRKENLARHARRIELGTWIRLGRGEAACGGHDKDSILANALEAIIGAVYLDGGLDAADSLIATLLEDDLDRRARDGGLASSQDPRTQLQEILQADGSGTPTYRLAATEGPDHRPRFTMEVTAGGEVLGRGTGGTKQEAAREAARQALDARQGAR